MLPMLSRLCAMPVLAVCLAGFASSREKLSILPTANDAQAPLKDRHGDLLPAGAVGRLGTVRMRATADALVVLGDGKSLLTVSGGRTVGRWDAQTGLLLGETHLPGPGSWASAISPDGKTLAVGEINGIRLWDIAAGKRTHFLPLQSSPFRFAPDSKTLVTSQQKPHEVVRVWDLAGGRERVLAEFHVPGMPYDFGFAPDGGRLYGVFDDRSLRAWSLHDGKQLWAIERGATRLAVSSDGKMLLTDDTFQSDLFLLDAQTGTHIGTIGISEKRSTAQITLSSDGIHVAQLTSDGETVLWSLATRKLVHRFPGASPQIAFAVDGKTLFTAGALVLRWDVATGKMLYTDARGDGHVGPVRSLAFAPDGRSLASTGKDGTLRLWSLGDGSHRMLQTSLAIDPSSFYIGVDRSSVCFSPEGRHILVTVDPTKLSLIDARTGGEVRGFMLPNRHAIASATFRADGKEVWAQGAAEMFYSVSRPSLPVHRWDTATGNLTLTYSIPVNFANANAFSPDGRLLFASGHKLMDLKTGHFSPLFSAPIDLGYSGSVFSPDCYLLALNGFHRTYGLPMGEGASVNVYETVTRRLVARTKAVSDRYYDLAFSHDGRLMAAAGGAALYVWQSATGKLLLRLEASGRLRQWNAVSFANCLAFAPDGKTLATGHADGTILFWDLAKAWANLSAPAEVDGEACWNDLALADAAQAHQAIESLVAVPGRTLALLRQKMAPVIIDPQWLAARLEELGSSKFQIRDAATRDLKKVGDAIESELRRLVEIPPSLEVRARLILILKTVEPGQESVPPLEEVRKLRAVTVLERIGTPEARALLRELAAGAPDARLTQAAKAALERLQRG